LKNAGFSKVTFTRLAKGIVSVYFGEKRKKRINSGVGRAAFVDPLNIQGNFSQNTEYNPLQPALDQEKITGNGCVEGCGKLKRRLLP